MKLATKFCLVPSALIMALWIGAAPASAASTRAEYIAQVDPICQAFVGPENEAYASYNRDFKRMIRAAKSGRVNVFLRQTRRTAGSLIQYTQVHASVTEQIAAVPLPAADTGTIGAWLNGRRQSDALASSAATALSRLRIEKYFRLAEQADRAEAAGVRAITGFGFQVCGVTPV